MDRNRRAAAMTLLVAFLSACGSATNPHTSTPTAPPASTTRTAPTAPATRDAVADCADQIDYWITTEYLQGKPDRGDYQEMGLGSAEGLALRQLEQHLSQTIQAFPAPTPANLRRQELASCDAAGASAVATATKPPVWP